MGYNNLGIFTPDTPSVVTPGTAPLTNPTPPVTSNPAPTAPITSSGGKSPETLVNTIANPPPAVNGVLNPATGLVERGVTPTTSNPAPNPAPNATPPTPPAPPPPPPTVTTSDAERMKAIEASLGIGAPPTPPTTSPEDAAILSGAKTARDALNTQIADADKQAADLQNQLNEYKQIAGTGTSMAGAIGLESEAARNVQFKLDSLNIARTTLTTKLNNQNTVINEIQQTTQQNYANAVQAYNTQFSQAFQIYSIMDKQNTEIQNNASANLDVLGKTYTAQIQAGTLTFDQITPLQQAKINELETQAHIPLGSTLAMLQTLKPGEEKIYSGFDTKTGQFTYVTKDTNNTISVRSINPVDVPSSSELGGAQFYKYPNSSSVYTKDGNPVSLAQYKQMTNQQNTPDSQVKFDGIKTVTPKPSGTKPATGTVSSYQVDSSGKVWKVTTKNGKETSKVEQKGTSTPSAGAVQAMLTDFQAKQGSDHGIDPAVWADNLTKWLDRGYSLASFKSNFGSFPKNSASKLNEYTGM